MPILVHLQRAALFALLLQVGSFRLLASSCGCRVSPAHVPFERRLVIADETAPGYLALVTHTLCRRFFLLPEHLPTLQDGSWDNVPFPPKTQPIPTVTVHSHRRNSSDVLCVTASDGTYGYQHPLPYPYLLVAGVR